MFFFGSRNDRSHQTEAQSKSAEAFIKASGYEEEALKDLITDLNQKIADLMAAKNYNMAHKISTHLANATQYAADHGYFDLVNDPNYLTCLDEIAPCVNSGEANPDPYRALIEAARHRPKEERTPSV